MQNNQISNLNVLTKQVTLFAKRYSSVYYYPFLKIIILFHLSWTTDLSKEYK